MRTKQLVSVRDVRAIPEEVLLGAARGFVDAMIDNHFVIPSGFKGVVTCRLMTMKERAPNGSVEVDATNLEKAGG